MKLNLISLSTVKTHLGISGTDQDSAITAMIPIVSADVRRILNCQFDDYTSASYVSGSAELDVYNNATEYKKYLGQNIQPLKMGLVIEGENIPDDTYIISEDPDTGVYTMSAEATGSGDYVYPTITVSQWPTIAKMIYYRVSKQTTASAADETVQSRSVGPLSVNYGATQINKRWNYPQTLIDDLGVPFMEVG
jgi:hypothetical protein